MLSAFPCIRNEDPHRRKREGVRRRGLIHGWFSISRAVLAPVILSFAGSVPYIQAQKQILTQGMCQVL